MKESWKMKAEKLERKVKRLEAKNRKQERQIIKLFKHNSKCTTDRFSALGCVCGLYKKRG